MYHWSHPQLNGAPPAPRGESPFAYDSKGSRLVLFGGWANRWFDDFYSLDVGSVVGPPYAITGIEPHIGPITGNTIVRIEGLDFVKDPPCLIRFASRKGAKDVPGTFISSTEIECVSPDFTEYGAGEVDVRVSLKGDSYTTTYQRYNFFHVTDCSHCIAIGPGVLRGSGASIPNMFLILARDTEGADRTTGGDEFTVTIKNAETGVKHDHDIEDEGNGRYMVTFNVPEAAQYEITVEFEGTYGGKTGPILGSPFLVTYSDGVSQQANKLGGPIVMKEIKNDISALEKFTREVLKGLATKVPEDNINVLVKVKGYLKAVVEKQYVHCYACTLCPMPCYFESCRPCCFCTICCHGSCCLSHSARTHQQHAAMSYNISGIGQRRLVFSYKTLGST